MAAWAMFVLVALSAVLLCLWLQPNLESWALLSLHGVPTRAAPGSNAALGKRDPLPATTGSPTRLLNAQLEESKAGVASKEDAHYRSMRGSSLTIAGGNATASGPYRGIELAHLLKAGGSAAFASVSRAAVCKEGVCLRHVGPGYIRQKYFFLLSGAPKERPYFRIQVMREPCSYYVSMWRFQGLYQGANRHPHQHQKKCLSGNASLAEYFPPSLQNRKAPFGAPSLQSRNALFSAAEHPPAFQRWMQSLHSKAEVGALSHRLWCTERQSYPATTPQWDDGQLTECARRLPPDSARELRDALDHPARLFANVHCWVDTANHDADLAACLRMFERAHPGSIDLARVAAMEAKRPRRESWPCDGMYSPELRERVLRMDSRVFQIFGYKCCQPRAI